MTRDEGIEICIEALKENEDGSDAYYSLLEDLQKLKGESEERNMEKLYVVTADGYKDDYGCSIYLLGVFKDEESANEAKAKYPELDVMITEAEIGKEYPLKPMDEYTNYLFENNNYLGGYAE